MPAHPPTMAPWQAAYRADRDELLIHRVRIMSRLAGPPVVLLTAYMVSQEPTSVGLRSGMGVAFAAAIGIGWLLTHVPAARRNALPTSLFAILALVAVAATSWRLTPADIEIAPLNALAIFLASTLLFPWGPRAQGVVCLAVVIGYVWAIGHAPTQAQGYSIGMLASLTPIAVVGARLIEGWRAAAFERTWQQEQLVSLARDLADAHDTDDILARTLTAGQSLLAAHSRAATLYVRGSGTHRIAAEQDDAPREQWWVGMEFPDELDVSQALVVRGELELPDELPGSPVARLLLDDGVHHSLFLLMRHGDEVIGALVFSRRSPEPFTAADRRLGRAIANQAAQALRNARLVADLRRANQLKSEFVSTMSHELRTPINVIIGFAEMLRDGELADGDKVLSVDRIDAAARDLLELVEGTLEIGRLEADRAAPRSEPIILQSFWRHLGAVCARMPRSGGVALRWGEGLPPVEIDADPRKLALIVRNLTGNALKFTAEGEVRVGAILELDRLVVTVADTGIGIRPEDHAVIFDMFRQADGSDNRRYGGTGLGLYIVRRFVEQLGGSVEVESAVGRGSTFTVRLPVSVRRGATLRAA